MIQALLLLQVSSSSSLLFGVGWGKVKAQVGLSLSRGLLGPWPGGRVKSGHCWLPEGHRQTTDKLGVRGQTD